MLRAWCQAFPPASHRVLLTLGNGWSTEEPTGRSPQNSGVDSSLFPTVFEKVKASLIRFYIWKIDLIMPTSRGLQMTNKKEQGIGRAFDNAGFLSSKPEVVHSVWLRQSGETRENCSGGASGWEISSLPYRQTRKLGFALSKGCCHTNNCIMI